jgi:hypothetical protein
MKNNNKWYSTLLALLLVGFMLVLTTWVLGLVLSEYNDTKWMEKYLKAYASAESWVEMAMLDIKEWKLTNVVDVNNAKSKIVDTEGWNKANFINYSFNWLARDTSDVELEPGEYDFIPLTDGSNKTKNFFLTTTWWGQSIHWNLIWSKWGISWTWNLNMLSTWTYKYLNWNEFEYISDKKVWDFISENSDIFLRLYNPNSSKIKYNFKIAAGQSDKFIKNEFEIESSWIVKLWWKTFKQNLDVDFENSKYTNLLKYSIYNN